MRNLQNPNLSSFENLAIENLTKRTNIQSPSTVYPQISIANCIFIINNLSSSQSYCAGK